MKSVEFSRLPLRDLALLSDLVKSRQISPVATRFKITNSAVSYALDRLRAELDDELLIRESHGIRPTLRAQQYAQEIDRILARLSQMGEQDGFEPSISQRHFKIVATDYEIGLFLGDIFKGILSECPGATISMEKLTSNFSADRLHGEVDLLFAPQNIDLSAIRCQRLATEPYAVFYDPACRSEPNSLKRYQEARHAIVDFGGGARSEVDQILKRQGSTRKIHFTAPTFAALANVIAGTDLITTLPMGFRRGPFAGLAHCQPPLLLGPIRLYMAYSQAKETDPALLYLLDRVKEAVSA